MNKLIALFFLVFAFYNLQAQTREFNSKDNLVRSIEVTGSSEIEVPPDEIIVAIRIEEYWKEELQKHAKYEDYKTIIPIETIEEELLKQLYNLDVKSDEIKVSSIGNHSREYGKDFRKGKTFELRLKDFSLVEKIVNNLEVRGVDYIRINELKNKDIAKYREQVKKDALKAAYNKAKYLLETLNKKVGDPIKIEEIEQGNDFTPYYRANFELSNSALGKVGSSETNNIKDIKLKYEIKAVFEIKD